jgi:hypothetical protein
MDGANDFALNWLGAAVDVLADKGPLPLDALGQFLLDTSHHPRARHRAYELIASARPALAAQLLDGLLMDPGPELRREAVARWIQRAEEASKGTDRDAGTILYRQALNAARDAAQVSAISARLRELGHSVNVTQVFGFLTNWHLIGPFDNTAKQGFEAVYPPETGLRLDDACPGKTGSVRWTPFASTNEYGMIDLNRGIGKLKEVTGYARTEFHSDREQQIELRLGCKNAWKLWINGDYVFGRDEYHMGIEIDQYRFPVRLRPGPNVILVKLCQNELNEDWTVEWEFQLRVTDSLGTPVRAAQPSAPSRG